MRTTPHRSFRRSRVSAGVALLALVALLSCVDGGSVGTGMPVSMSIAPSFQLVPADFESGPIGSIRLTARDAETSEIVGSSEEEVDPAAPEWVLELGVDLRGASSLDVVVEVELFSAGLIEWSGRVGPISLTSGLITDVQQIDVFRGPLENLLVESISVVEPPTRLLVGSVATATADFELIAGANVTPELFWVSLDPTVATVVAVDGVATIVGVLPGTATIAVAAGTASEEFTVEVLPRVQSVEVGPLTASLDLLGLGLQFTATVTDGFGNPAPDEPITWTSSDPSVATVDASGLATSVGIGFAEIRATAGGVTGAAGLSVIVPLGVPTWVGGALGAANDWFEASNWSTGIVPGIADMVLIPITQNPPILTASFQVLDLDVESGAVVDLGGLSHFVQGGFAVDGLLQNGTVIVSTTAGTGLRGTVDGLRTNADRALSGDLFVGGELQIAEQSLTVGANTLVVTDRLRLVSFPGTATLVMDDPASFVQVVGDVSFGTAGVASTLSAGVLSVAGDFDVASGSYTATGTHITQLGGSGPQSLSMSGSGASGNRFQRLDIVPDAAVTVASDIHVTGDLVVMGTLAVPQGQTLDVGGAILLQAGATLDVGGVLSAVGGCIDSGGLVLGLGSHPCAIPQLVKTWVGGAVGALTDWNDPDNWNPVGVPLATDSVLIDLTQNLPVLLDDVIIGGLEVVTGATLDLGGFSLTVNGDLQADEAIVNGEVVLGGSGLVLEGTVPDLRVLGSRTLTGALTATGDAVVDNVVLGIGANTMAVGGSVSVQGSGARLDMRVAGGVVDVEGDILFDGGTEAGWLTAGQIRVGGDFTVAATSSTVSFAGSGTHSVVLDGTALQTITMSNPGSSTQRFGGLDIRNNFAGAAFATDVVVLGSFDVDSDASVDAADDALSVAGAVSFSGGVSLRELVVIGNLTGFSGTVPGDMTVAAGFDLPASVTVVGNVLTTATLEVGPNALTVGGNLTVDGAAGRLAMRDASAAVDVAGDVFFQGGTEAGWLTQGVLSVAGDFSANDVISGASFAASGSHRVELNGSGPQAITLTNPSASGHRFQDLTIGNTTATVTLATDVVAIGAVDIVSAATVDAFDDVLSVGGALTLSPATSLQELVVIGNLTALSGTVPGDMTVAANFDLPASATVVGDVSTTATFGIGANTLSVGGSLSTGGASGRLDMTDAAGVIDVAGDVLFDGGTEAGWLTAGEIRVGGDLTALVNNSASSFAGTGGHSVTLDGVAAQSVSLANPSATGQRFEDLAVTNSSASVSFLTDVVATGTLDIASDATLDASDDVVSVEGALALSAATSLLELRVIGDLTSFSGTVPGDMTVVAGFNLPSSVNVLGNVSTTATLGIGANTLTVGGNVSTSGGVGRLDMRDPASLVDVAGDVVFDGATELGWLTAGELRVAGDFTANVTNSGTSFAGSVDHRVTMDGAAQQTIFFANPGISGQRFGDLALTNTASSIVFASDAVIDDGLTIVAGAVADASDDVLSIGGFFNDGSDGISLQELRVVGDLSSMPGGLAADMTVDVGFNLPGSVTIFGDVVTNATLGVGANTLTVSGNLATRTGTGRLDMRDALSVVDVTGDVLFDGASEAGWLTAGELQVGGDFTATSTNSSTSFAGMGTHGVVLDGTLQLQTVTFSAPGTAQQRFNDLTIVSGQFPDAFASVVSVTGTFDGQSIALARVAGSDARLDVSGTLFIDVMSMDGLPLYLQSSVAPGAHTMSDVTWANMDPDEVQLLVQLPGGGPNNPAVFGGMNFDAPVLFSDGGHLETVRNTAGSTGDLFVDLSGATPIRLLATILEGLNTTVLW